MITKAENLEFLKQKIREIRSAKFSADIHSLLQLPNNVITILKADNEGNVWFFTSSNGVYAGNMDKNFYASLDFYNKASDCRLHIDGSAAIIHDQSELQALAAISNKKNLSYNTVLIKLKIRKAEYFEARTASQLSFKETLRNIFIQLFHSDTHRRFDFLETVPQKF